ncbi:hypothetical protein [Devosia sp.]|uniref:hypothetical protein n=1 Tax=Devosia sp. TaxID=1871048 RepID=UPI003A8EDA39
MAAASSSPFAAVVNWFVKLRADRARRATYESLLTLENSRLDDLGITRQDLFEAMNAPSRAAGLKLARSRSESARNWLDR